jgi:hypothetical protein
MKHGIIFWGNSIDNKRVGQLQEKVVRIMKGLNPEFHANLYSKRWKY